MFPGKRPHRAVFSVPSVEFDAIGNEVGALEPIGAAWVSISPLSNRWRTAVENSGKSATITHQVECSRPVFDIPATAQMTAGGRVYQVEAVMDVPNGAETMLFVSEKRV